MNVVAFASSHRIGLTAQLTEQAIAFLETGDERFLFLSGEREQFPGLRAKLRDRRVPHATIHGLDEHAHFGRLVREVTACTDEVKPDLVLTHTNWQLALAWSVRLRSEKKFNIAYTIHGYRHNHPVRSVVARALIGAGLAVCADRVVAPCTYLGRRFGLLRAKTAIIALGEDAAFFGRYEAPDYAGRTRRLVFAGEFRTGKGQDMLIRALKRYTHDSGDQEVELHLPGKGQLLPRCQELARALGIADKVHFPGFLSREEIIDLYRRCHLALVPSNVETFGHCVVEPFVLGRVVLTRHVGVAEDIIREGETGFFFEDEDELTAVLGRLIRDESTCARVAARAFACRDPFRWERVCQAYREEVFRLATRDR